MNVICDTNIWYDLASGEISLDSKGLNFTPTFVNLDEIATSPKLLDEIEKSRGAIRAMMKAKTGIFIPPLQYVAMISDPKIKYDVREEIPELLDATEKIAKGHSILQDKKEGMAEWMEASREPFREFANVLMNQVEKVREQITDIRNHRKNSSIDGYRKLLCQWVKTALNIEINPTEMDWSELELFEKTWMAFFTELEVSKMKFNPNDFYDIFNLVYVSKRDLYFTKDKKIIDIIGRAGLSHYLFGKK